MGKPLKVDAVRSEVKEPKIIEPSGYLIQGQEAARAALRARLPAPRDELSPIRNKRGLFQPGASGNPCGLTREVREQRRAVREWLEDVCHYELPDDPSAEGTGDLLIDAFVRGIKSDNTKLILATAHYRFGAPAKRVELSGPEGGPMQAAVLTDAALLAIAGRGQDGGESSG